MQIPVSLPDPAALAPSIRRDVQATTPVTPLASLAGTTEAPDPRLSLQWAQPVAGQPASDPTRPAPERASANTQSPAGSVAGAPASPTSAAVQWSEPARALSQMLRAYGHLTDADGGVPWPAPARTDNPHDAPPAQQVLHFMQRLYVGLSQSDVFAAQHLVQAWQKIKPRASDAPIDVPEPSNEAGQYQRWMDAIAPDSPSAEQATQMLVSGKMQWHGEVLPGLMLRVQREDAWREDPQHPGQAQKGASLKVEIELPRCGTLRVRAAQWGDHMDVRVQLPPEANGLGLQSAWPELETRMADLHMPDMHLSLEPTP